MVKEGHDSTVRPKVVTYEFEKGRMLLDAWAADGKPALSRYFHGWMRVLGVVTITAASVSLVLSDFSHTEQDHVFSGLRRSVLGWWTTFVALDEADVAKAMAVRQAKGQANSDRSSSSLFASEAALAKFAKADAAGGAQADPSEGQPSRAGGERP